MSISDLSIFQDLKSAIKSGDITKVEILLQEWRSDSSIPGPTPSDLDELVPRAAEGVGQPAILEYLLSQGATSDIGAYTTGVTRSPQIFEIFIKNGWKPQGGLFHTHPENPELVALFLAHGGNPNPQIEIWEGYLPLETAALCAPLESVKILLSYGAQIGPESRAMNAAARGDVPDRIPIMSLLLEHGADINAQAEDYPAPSEGRQLGRKGTPLHSAAKWGNKEAMVWLLEHGADPDVKNEMGETAKEWGKRFERDGSERVLRIRRDINRKNQKIKKAAAEEEKKKKAEAANAEEMHSRLSQVGLD